MGAMIDGVKGTVLLTTFGSKVVRRTVPLTLQFVIEMRKEYNLPVNDIY